MNLDFCLGAHCEPAAELSMDTQVFRKFTEARVNDGGSDQQDVVSQREPRQPRTSAGQRERNERERQQEVEEFGENEAQRSGF